MRAARFGDSGSIGISSSMAAKRARVAAASKAADRQAWRSV